MYYYYLGLTVESPEREQAIIFRNTLLEELSISTRGRMFVPINTDLMQNQKFMKLVAFMNPSDVLIMHDMTRSTVNIFNLSQVLGLLYDKGLNIINMAFPRINTFDYPFLYEELSELLILTQNYTVFLYHIAMRTLHMFDMNKVVPLLDMDKEFSSFIRHTIRNEIRSFQLMPTVTDFLDYITSQESLQYVQQTIGSQLPILFDDSFESLQYFNEYAQMS